MTTFLEKFIKFGGNEGAKLAAEGIARALKNEQLKWRNDVLLFAEKYAKANEFFRMEDIHNLWTQQGGEDPRSDKVWGGIARGILKYGYGEFYEYAKAANIKSHGSIIIVYRSKIYEKT